MSRPLVLSTVKYGFEYVDSGYMISQDFKYT